MEKVISRRAIGRVRDKVYEKLTEKSRSSSADNGLAWTDLSTLAAFTSHGIPGHLRSTQVPQWGREPRAAGGIPHFVDVALGSLTISAQKAPP